MILAPPDHDSLATAGRLQAGVTISILPCVLFYLLSSATTLGLPAAP